MTGKTLKVVVFVGVLAAVFALSACSASGANDLEGTNWKLDSIGGTAVTHDATLTFSADNAVGGSSGCNSFGGTYALVDGTLTFPDPLVSTLMACEEGVMEFETQYLNALQTSPALARSGNQLTLTTPDGVTLVFSPA